MRVIGITGGVGAGKSAVLKLLTELVPCIVLRADDIAKETILPGGAAYIPIVRLLGEDILDDNGYIDRGIMAERIFADDLLCGKVNSIIHPLTKEAIRAKIADAGRDGSFEYCFVEAALLIEAGYQDICDEFWYIYASVEERINRLTADRGYSIRKCKSIMDNQLSDEDFRKHCSIVIDNSGSPDDTRKQLKKILEIHNISEEMT